MQVFKDGTEADSMNLFFYAIIPWLLLAIFWVYGAIKEKNKDYWTAAGICFIIGITPINFILLALVIIFLIVGCLLALLSFIGDSIFEYLTNKTNKTK
tara:strand:+ start:471 stop:764 length:294 start_codon:yes stop_codon:yes gene_type:complete